MTNSARRSRVAAAGGALAGIAVGLLLGVMVTLALVTALARFRQFYMEEVSDLMGPIAAPVLLASLLGIAIGWRSTRAVAAAAAGTLLGAAAGVLLGAGISWAGGAHAADQWASATIGGGAGALTGAALALLRRHDAATHALALVMIAGAACSDRVPRVDVETQPAPPMLADEIESVIFLAGDAGAARLGSSPLLNALGDEVEAWSRTIARDSAVVVVMLGDIVYPDGVREPGSPGFAQDSTIVASQAALVRRESARRYASRMYFVAGNHDWGLRDDREGALRLRNLEQLLSRFRAAGDAVALLPAAGTGTPHVVEAGRLRIVLLDTAWWIFGSDSARKQDALSALRRILADEQDRPVMIAAHHPIASAGPHGARAPSWRNLGIGYLLSRSGTIQQDLESVVYRDLLSGLRVIFTEVRRPLLFAGGHDHSLQVLRHGGAGEPHFSVVSGSASKLSAVGHTEGILFGRMAPGYMRVVVRRSGAVDLFVVAAPAEYLDCGSPGEPDNGRCMRDGRQAFAEVFSTRLLPAAQSRAPLR